MPAISLTACLASVTAVLRLADFYLNHEARIVTAWRWGIRFLAIDRLLSLVLIRSATAD